MLVGVQEGFSCIEIGEEKFLLKDVSVRCPYSDKTSAPFLWAVLATCMYPIGLPAFMYWSLHSFGIPALAKKRMDNAILHQLLQVYKHHTHRSLLNKISYFVGVGSDGSSQKSHEKVLRERVESMFQHASGGEVSLTFEKLMNYLDEIGISGEHEEEVQVLMLKFDDDGNGTLEIDEFFEMIKDVVLHASTISGHETLESLDEQQLELLCRVP